MAVVIPINREINGTSYFDLQAVLDDVTYTLEFRWNVRLEAWFMNVLDITGTAAHQVGIRLVTDYPYNQRLANRVPSGMLAVIDTAAPEGQEEDPDFDSLGNRHQLVYLTEADLA